MKVISEHIVGEYKYITVQVGKDEEIYTKKKKRSKNANAYFWELLQQLCEVMNLDVIEQYKERVKDLGIFRQWEIDSKNVPTFVKMWEDKGIAWFCDIVDEIGDKTIINAYYGSSSYNSKQFSRLIDNLIQDCESVGIQTISDEEIKELIRSEYE